MTQTIPSQRILVVDDEPLILQTMEMLLACDGHRVETASDGQSALKKLAAHPFDIVFTDHNMPTMSGDVLAIAIKKQSPQQIVVMLTGRAQPVGQKKGEQACVDFALQKPFHIQELRAIIQKAALKQVADAPGQRS